MIKNIVLKLSLVLCLINAGSCNDNTILPDEISNEIKVSCQMSDHTDTTSSKEIWVSCYITNGCADRGFNFIGHCWNINSDSLPDINSSINKIAEHDLAKYPYRITKEAINLYYYVPVLTGIPVSIIDTSLIVRGFIIFNDSLIRYSDPLIISNPIEYAY